MLPTLSFGQLLVQGSDTLSCFTKKEVKVIAKIILHEQELDTLYKLEKQKSHALSQQIDAYEDIIANDSLIVREKDIQIENRDAIIKGKDEEISCLHNQVNRGKVKFWVTSGTLVAAIVYLIFN